MNIADEDVNHLNKDKNEEWSPCHLKHPHYPKNTKHLRTDTAIITMTILLMMTLLMMMMMMMSSMTLRLMITMYLSNLFDGLKGVEEGGEEIGKDRQEVDYVHEAFYELPPVIVIVQIY